MEPLKHMNKNSKKHSLESTKTLNKAADKVADPLFDSDDFFDANDLVQVKYEMLRKVAKENWKVSKAANAFGFSRLSFYNAQSRFEQGGLEGLTPKKRGLKSGHKLTDEVMDFIMICLERDLHLSVIDLSKKLKNELKITVHKRSIERAILRSKKKQKK